MKLDDTHIELVASALRSGESYRTIARELGCDKTTVSKFVSTKLPNLKSERRNQNDAPAAEMRVLVIDIETRPALAYVWGAWKQNVHPPQIVEPKAVISFAARWLGNDGKTIFYSDEHSGHKRMVKAAHKLLDQADAVIHYNGKRFDIPHLNTEFALLGLSPPSPYRQIDLLLTARRKFNFSHNKLDHVASLMLDEHKLEHEGFALWTKCMNGDVNAWDRMRDYNVHDTELTERLYFELRPWIDNHPSHAAFHADTRCPSCASENLRRQGFTTTKTGRYQQYQCRDCGSWTRDTHRVMSTGVTPTSAW